VDHSGEVLRPHAHNSPNTHLINEGEMTVWKMRSGQRYGTFKKGHVLDVKPSMCDRAEVCKEGCTFVEGSEPDRCREIRQMGVLHQDGFGRLERHRYGRCQLHTRAVTSLGRKMASTMLGGYGYTVSLRSLKDQMLKMPGVET
jgi:hypothetical protein